MSQFDRGSMGTMNYDEEVNKMRNTKTVNSSCYMNMNQINLGSEFIKG